MAGKIANLNLVRVRDYFYFIKIFKSTHVVAILQKNSFLNAPNSNWLFFPPFLCSKCNFDLGAPFFDKF